jgi:hypothetical protein
MEDIDLHKLEPSLDDDYGPVNLNNEEPDDLSFLRKLEPCEDGCLANLARLIVARCLGSLEANSMYIEAVHTLLVQHFASQVANKREETLEKLQKQVEMLRNALEPFADTNCEDERGTSEDELLSCEEYDRPRDEWCAVCNAKQVLFEIEPKGVVMSAMGKVIPLFLCKD